MRHSSLINNSGNEFLIARDHMLTILKKNAIALSDLYNKSNTLKLEINVNSATKNCKITLQENNL